MNIFNLFFMLKIALKHWLALFAAAIICAGAVYGYFNFIAEPKYSAKGAVVITNGEILKESTEISSGVDGSVITNEETVEAETIRNTDIVTSINFLDTAIDYLEDPGIYKRLAEKLGNKYAFSDLKSRTSISRRADNSLFVDVTFTATTRNEAIAIINEFIKLIPDFMSEQVTNSSVYYSLAYSASEVYMNDITMILLAGVGGAAVVYIIIFLIYSADNIIRDEESFKDHIDINVIGVVPDFASSKSAESKYYKYGRYYYGYGGNKYAK